MPFRMSGMAFYLPGAARHSGQNKERKRLFLFILMKSYGKERGFKTTFPYQFSIFN
jgi:hypothetical protein